MIKTFKFLQENGDYKREVTYQEVVETVNFNMNILYDGSAPIEQIEVTINEVCRQLNVNPPN